MEENVTMMTVLQELREFRADNNKRWEENEKRWISMEKIVATLEEISKKSEQRLTELEKGRKEDKKEILDVLDTMQKSIDNRLTEMKDYMDLKFEKIDLALAVNNMEHAEFRKLLKAYGIKLDFYGARLQSLERWRDEMNGSLVGTY